MRDLFKFWGFSPDVFMATVGPDRPIACEPGENAESVFGRIEVRGDIADHCGPFRNAAAAGWWTWLALDRSKKARGEPIIWLVTRNGRKWPIVCRTSSNEFCFFFDVDESIRFIQNERYVVHRPPTYVRLGINPARLPGWVRKAGCRSFDTLRRIRRSSAPEFPASPDDPAVDVWRYLIRSIVGIYTNAEPVPLWPDHKTFATILYQHVDTDDCIRTPSVLAAFQSVLDRVNMRACWMVVANVAEQTVCALDDLHAAGHEIGCHGAFHDHRLPFLPMDQITARLDYARRILDRYDCTGFCSPSYLRSADLFAALDGRFSYDASMHDIVQHPAGPRSMREGCSTCFPFVIEGTGVLELPTTVAEDRDLELEGLAPGAALQRQIERIGQVKARHGVASIISHPEPYLTARPNWLAAYTELVQYVAEDGNVWKTTPAEIERHWRDRQSRIESMWESTPSSDSFEGDPHLAILASDCLDLAQTISD